MLRHTLYSWDFGLGIIIKLSGLLIWTFGILNPIFISYACFIRR